MAKAKKSTSKSKKKPTHARAKPRAAHRAKKAEPALSTDDVRSLVKPPPNYIEIIEQFMSRWGQFKRYIRSGDTTPAQLASKARKSDKRWKAEEALAQKQQAKMRPVRDARLRAEADTWSAFLNVWDITKAQFDDHPEIADAMDPVRTLLTNAPKKKSEPSGGAPPAS